MTLLVAKFDTKTIWTSVGKPTIHLQAMGMVPAIPARLLEVGMKRLYNYGSTGEIVSVRKEEKWIHLSIHEKSHPDSNGRIYLRRHKPETLIPILLDEPKLVDLVLVNGYNEEIGHGRASE